MIMLLPRGGKLKDQELSKYRFKETFQVEFVVEATTYEKAKDMYNKLFDKNIQLGYDTWKDRAGRTIEDKNFIGGKFYVSVKGQETDTTLVEEIWGEEE
jgi:hypothetical protein